MKKIFKLPGQAAKKLKKGVKDHEVDFYRWFAYGAILLLLALLAIFYGPLMYIFAILFIIAVIDIFYNRYFKYSAIGRARH